LKGDDINNKFSGSAETEKYQKGTRAHKSKKNENLYQNYVAALSSLRMAFLYAAWQINICVKYFSYSKFVQIFRHQFDWKLMAVVLRRPLKSQEPQPLI